MNETGPFAAELREAEEELKTTLERACSTNLSRADTGELIRVDEMLAIASEAAKKAISIRRRRHQDPAPSRRSARPAEHREFELESRQDGPQVVRDAREHGGALFDRAFDT